MVSSSQVIFKMTQRVILSVLLLQLINRGLALDLDLVRPIYESEYWRETHPALAKWIKMSELAYKTVGTKFSVANRITGGQAATVNQFPYQAGLVVTLPTQESFCGGSLISNNYVLTAAHCLDTSNMATVLLGAHNVSMASEATRAIQLIMARNFKIHEGYNSSQYQNDIALLQLNSPVTLTSAITLINLPKLSQVETTFANTRATVSGWGRYLDTVDLLSQVLQYVDLTILDNSGCTPFFGTAVTTMKVCTSGANRVGPCGGDSGGPVVIEEDGLKVQVGLVSFSVGFGCQLGWPTVHTRISKYLSWISNNADATIRT